MLLGKRLYTLLMFVLVSILGGVLVAGLMVPVVGIAANSGRDAVSGVSDLPTELEAPPQWERSRLLDNKNNVLAYFYDQNRVYVPLAKISDFMKKAQVGIEDHRFYEHGAMDLTGTLRALVSTTQGNTQGGSSLTQQYVRMVLLEKAMASNDEAAAAAAKENSVARKIRELRYAIAVEKEFSKDQILEFYLNMAYYGDGAYGVEAAAKHYFGVSAVRLDLAQSAMLAGLVRNPVATTPAAHPVQAIERRNNVLDRLAELKVVNPQEAAVAKTTPFDRKKMTTARAGCANSEFPFVCDYALKTMLKKATGLGATELDRQQRIYRGGLTIKTQIDTAAQRSAEKTLAKRVSGKDPVVAAITMLEPATGLVRAMTQNRQTMGRKPGQSYWNYAVNRDMGGAEGFLGGSTFKIFTAAAALDSGFGANTSFKVSSNQNYGGQIFRSCDGPFRLAKSWNVRGPQNGTYNLWSGTTGSVNNYFVQLEQAVGICPVVKMAKAAGLEMSSGEDLLSQSAFPSFTLGAAGITPLSLTTAYGTFANRGIRCDPVILKSITTKDGTSIPVPSANCRRTVRQEVADSINRIFQGPFTSGTLRGSQIYGYRMAGKTGTTSDNKANWAIGYTPDLVTSAMVSVDSSPKYKKFWKKHRRNLQGIRLPESGSVFSGFGSDVGRKLFRPAMAKALKDLDERHSFSDPSQSVLAGDSVTLPDCSGLGPSACGAQLRAAGFSVYYKYVYSDVIAVGGLVSISQAGQAGKGSQVGVLISKGPKPKETTPPTTTKPPGKRR